MPPNWSEWKQLTVGAAPTGRAVPITRSGTPGPAPGAVRLAGRQPDGPLRHHSPEISAVERQQPARPGAPDWGELVRSGHLGYPQESIGYLELQFLSSSQRRGQIASRSPRRLSKAPDRQQLCACTTPPITEQRLNLALSVPGALAPTLSPTPTGSRVVSIRACRAL